jgi:hypothetical protein
VLTAQSYLGAVSAFSKPAAHKRLEEKINASTEAKALPLAATLEAFR